MCAQEEDGWVHGEAGFLWEVKGLWDLIKVVKWSWCGESRVIETETRRGTALDRRFPEVENGFVKIDLKELWVQY